MNIIYVSSGCSEKKIKELQDNNFFKGMICAQKYHLLLMHGLSANTDDKITAISAIPTNRKWTKKVFFRSTTESDNKVSFWYSGFINMPFLRQITLYLNTLRKIRRIIKKQDNSVIICDVLNQSVSAAARKVGEKANIPVIGIVTDVPGYYVGDVNNNSKNKLSKLIGNYSKQSILKYDGYLLLTEAMNEVVNPNNKPYIVIEGHSDSEMSKRENILENKKEPKVIMYAGGNSKVYGMEMLVNAFKKLDLEDWELHIYGKGDYDSELTEISEKDDRIKFFGLVANTEIVERQIEATLLVNPRPTNEEYVKYSFPSKTLECMASGTPLITTQLPGMPTEYNKYVYIFDDESEAGYAETLKKVISIDKKELHNKGQSAKEFALSEKNNIAQAKKLFEFLLRLF